MFTLELVEDTYLDVYSLQLWAGELLVARGELIAHSISGALGIWGIFVEDDYRGQGHARNIMARLIDHAAASGHREVYLKVESHNTPAIALYVSLGFVEIDRHHVVKECPAAIITMSLSLTNRESSR